MVRTLFYPGRQGFWAVLAVIIAVMLAVGGCGNKGADTGLPASTGAPTVTHTSASGPAITDKVTFDQLTLESTPKAVKDRNGLVFLHFKYADYDGKVYECVMPQAMSEGEYTLSEWSSTFKAYRQPKVLAQKKVQSGHEELGDFPFISPKPQPEQPPEQAASQSGQTTPSIAPELPPLPTPVQEPASQGSGNLPPGLLPTP